MVLQAISEFGQIDDNLYNYVFDDVIRKTTNSRAAKPPKSGGP